MVHVYKVFRIIITNKMHMLGVGQLAGFEAVQQSWNGHNTLYSLSIARKLELEKKSEEEEKEEEYYAEIPVEVITTESVHNI